MLAIVLGGTVDGVTYAFSALTLSTYDVSLQSNVGPFLKLFKKICR